MILPFLATLLAALPLLTPPSDDAVAAARRHTSEHGAAIVGELAELLRLPNVASDAAGIEANATWLEQAYRRRGVTLERLTVPGAPPVLCGALRTPGTSRTLGVYVHYDGQPVDPERWTDPPFHPVLRSGSLADGAPSRPLPEAGEPVDPDWRLYARASGDDKAPLVAWLAALDALAAADIAPTVDLLFFFEGEEEAGSPHLARILETHRERIDVDAWLFCDGPIHQSGRPQLAFGVRGVAGMELTVYGPVAALHSGHYGNWAPNPALELSRLLASLKDADGNVLVDGWLDDVTPLGEGERAALAALPDVDADLRRQFGLAASEGDGTLAERLLLPSLNVRGLSAANVGAGARNVIPAEATASLDIRLVAGCDPAVMQQRVEDHVAGLGWHVVRETPDMDTRGRHPRIVRIARGRGGYPAARSPMDTPVLADVVAAAERAATRPLVLLPTLGGSLPLYLFTGTGAGPGAPIVIVPIANHDDNQHAPDENVRLGNLFDGVALFASLLTMDAS